VASPGVIAPGEGPAARPDETELLTAQEVADRLKIGKSTVYLLCRRGELPSLAIHRSVRIPADALRRWLEQRVQSAPHHE
jgi:excisionase family DNA binding protein